MMIATKRTIRAKRMILIILAAVLAAIIGVIALNKLHSDFSRLKETDQEILKEYDLFYAQEKASPLWQDYLISEKTLAFLPKGALYLYLVNPTHEINSIFAQKIILPDSFSIYSVYRVSILHPEVWRMKGGGNFNTLGKTYSLFGEQIYYIQYDESTALTQQYTSKHFLTFLAHESFHYYMQNQWRLEEYPYTESLTAEDLKLLRQEYAVLDAISQELQNGAEGRHRLLEDARRYLSIMGARITSNPNYIASELAKERDEGTATYAAIKASRLVGYDFGIMYFDNVKNVPFSDVFEQIDAGNLDASFLYTRMPYETGALLCELMDALEIPDWQGMLNSQTLEAPQTLYSVLNESIETIERELSD